MDPMFRRRSVTSHKSYRWHEWPTANAAVSKHARVLTPISRFYSYTIDQLATARRTVLTWASGLGL
jgi:hypothetical protein